MSEMGFEGPPGDDRLRQAAEPALGTDGADEVEVLFGASHTGLTRFAGSQIIQNTLRDEIRAYVRVAIGDRVATASTNQLDPGHMTQAARDAVEAAEASPPDPEFPGLARPEDVGSSEQLLRWEDRTALCSPHDRARAVSRILRVTGAASAAGIYETSAHAYALFSSTGVSCYDRHTRCVTTCLVEKGDATGWGEASSHSMAEVDVEAAAGRALAKAELGASAEDAKPGTYEVVLEPSAVATLIEYLSYAGFGAKQVIDGDSFLAARRGEDVASQSVTIADDVFHPSSVGIGFDFEGVPKRRVAVIDRGRATRPVNDLRTAARLGDELTGHFSGSNELGPYASNVVLEAGEQSFDELVGGVDTGLLVTRFHYVNILDRPRTLLTGMTRDGTFRIQGGRVIGAVRNMRFTENVLAAFATASGVGNELAAFAPEFGSFGSAAAPALRLGEFHFTSATSH